jgi:hypothetical protein
MTESRRGILLEDFGRYRAAEVNLGIGTDTFPHNFVEELRTAGILARVAAGQAHAVGACNQTSVPRATGDDRFLGKLGSQSTALGVKKSRQQLDQGVYDQSAARSGGRFGLPV